MLFRSRELRDAMSQVEDVASTRVGRTVAVQHADDLFTHLFVENPADSPVQG